MLRRGIGSLLLKEAIKEAINRGISIVQLHVQAPNDEVIYNLQYLSFNDKTNAIWKWIVITNWLAVKLIHLDA